MRNPQFYVSDKKPMPSIEIIKRAFLKKRSQNYVANMKHHLRRRNKANKNKVLVYNEVYVNSYV